MNAVFDPSILFISESDWFDDDKRDNFLKYLLDNLRTISDYKITKFYWSDDLDNLLWCFPNMPPWRVDRDLRNPLVQVIYRLFPKCTLDIQPNVSEPCRTQPELQCKCCKSDVDEHFMRMMHFLLTKSENVYFCIGQNNLQSDNGEYTFYCDCHTHTLKPVLISDCMQWLNHIDLTSDYWPRQNNNNEISKFRTGLSIHSLRMDSQNRFFYDYNFTSKFIDDIVEASTYQEAIFSAIAKRLLLSQSKASGCAGLNDEPVKNKRYNINGIRKPERRFRISGENRIHYCYPEAGKILFLRYFREGQHDTGLR